jgi:putative heme iron utilization protein
VAGKKDALDAMRALVARERSGVLSTLHAEREGWPFGSVTPYALSREGDPIVLLSSIAEHTRNLAADPRASLFVQDSRSLDRPQAGARVTLLVRAEVPGGAAADEAREAYFARFPDSREHLSAHDFAPHVLRVDSIRWIAGFGEMGWFDRAAWSGAPPRSKPTRAR